MDAIKTLWSLGVMSGTSLSGVNFSLIRTDGIDVSETGPTQIFLYNEELRQKIKMAQGRPDFPSAWKNELDVELTSFHAACAKEFLEGHDICPDVAGYHGHSLYHNAEQGICLQCGNAQMFAELTGIKTVGCFHQADMRGGGQGNPLEALYVSALVSDMEKPIAFLNLGGTASLVWIGVNGEICGFDAGPGNAAINDWVSRHGGLQMDYNGRLAIIGNIHPQILNSLMKHKYFALVPPKTADRDLFKDKLEHLEGLTLEDGAATVTAFIAESIAYSMALYLPEMPKQLIVCGGGTHNPTLLRFLRVRLPQVEVKTGGEIGINCEGFSAAAYAYLAVRSLYHMPLSIPSVTGVCEPCMGGEIFLP